MGELDVLWNQLEADLSCLPRVRAQIEAHLTSHIVGEILTEGRPVRAEVWGRFYSAVMRLEAGNDVSEAAKVADAMLMEYERRLPMYEVGPPESI